MQTSRYLRRAGFTLVELLVVILIISVLLTIGSVALRGAGGKGVTSALASTEALFDEARSIAVSKGSRSRILVDIDNPQDESYLRRIVIIFEQLDPAGAPTGNWQLSSRGYTLPDKVYFSRLHSTSDFQGGGGQLQEMNLTGVSGLYNGRYLFYEFNAEGICTTGLTGAGEYNGPSFVIGSGSRPRGGEPQTTSDGRLDFGGFVIWRNGSTSLFRDPQQIVGAASTENSTPF